MPIAEIQTGNATIHGITNNGSAFTISGYATFLLEQLKAAHKFNLREIKDETDFDAALVATNQCVELDITFKPSGATRAAAAAVAVFPTPLATVTLANFKVSLVNGTWTYVGDGTLDLMSNESGKMTLKIRKYSDATQNTALTTTVTG
jgi:hypothetical protein